MESNTMTTYKDLTPAPKVDKKTLNKMVWMSTMPVSYTHLSGFNTSWFVL